MKNKTIEINNMGLMKDMGQTLKNIEAKTY